MFVGKTEPDYVGARAVWTDEGRGELVLLEVARKVRIKDLPDDQKQLFKLVPGKLLEVARYLIEIVGGHRPVFLR
jgi:hypothetical protein